MFLNSTTNLCQYCPDGEYYDYTLDSCASWAGSCRGYWGYQRTCFEWTSPDILDLNTLSWVPSWDPSSIQITDNTQFELDTFWRTLDYYIDPSSDKLLEFGTKDYPYRTAKPVFAEILKHHSHTEREITVYLKEGTNTYIEDSSAYFLNLTSVTITSYSEDSTDPDFATITSKDSAVSGISSKSAFNIVKDLTLDTSSVVTGGNFTSYEEGSIGRSGDTFHVVRTSLYMNKITAKRQASVSTSGVLIYLLYLQDKIVDLRKHYYFSS